MAEKAGLNNGPQDGRRPEFGTPAALRFVITVLVVSATTGMLLFLGSAIGGIFSDKKEPLMVGALLGSIAGVVAGSLIAMALTDTSRTGSMWTGSLVGGLIGLGAGIAIPLMATPMRFAGVFALVSPGIGVAIGQTLIRLMEVPETEPPKTKPHGPYGDQRPYL